MNILQFFGLQKVVTLPQFVNAAIHVTCVHNILSFLSNQRYGNNNHYKLSRECDGIKCVQIYITLISLDVNFFHKSVYVYCLPLLSHMTFLRICRFILSLYVFTLLHLCCTHMDIAHIKTLQAFRESLVLKMKAFFF